MTKSKRALERETRFLQVLESSVRSQAQGVSPSAEYVLSHSDVSMVSLSLSTFNPSYTFPQLDRCFDKLHAKHSAEVHRTRRTLLLLIRRPPRSRRWPYCRVERSPCA